MHHFGVDPIEIKTCDNCGDQFHEEELTKDEEYDDVFYCNECKDNKE